MCSLNLFPEVRGFPSWLPGFVTAVVFVYTVQPHRLDYVQPFSVVSNLLLPLLLSELKGFQSVLNCTSLS